MMEMERNDKATCWTCPFWAGSSNILAAECRRSHPEELAVDEGHGTTWTSTHPINDWCGQHPDFFLEEESDD